MKRDLDLVRFVRIYVENAGDKVTRQRIRP